MIRAAEAIRHANTARRFKGVSAKALLDQWKEMVAQKDELVADGESKKLLALIF